MSFPFREITKSNFLGAPFIPPETGLKTGSDKLRIYMHFSVMPPLKFHSFQVDLFSHLVFIARNFPKTNYISKQLDNFPKSPYGVNIGWSRRESLLATTFIKVKELARIAEVLQQRRINQLCSPREYFPKHIRTQEILDSPFDAAKTCRSAREKTGNDDRSQSRQQNFFHAPVGVSSCKEVSKKIILCG